MGEISLRPITYEDTELIVKWRNSPDVRKNFFYREEFTKESHERWMREQVETGKVVQFIVMNGDIPIGSTYLRDINTSDKTAEYGVFIGEPIMRGRGYGCEVLKLTLEYGFVTLKLEKIIGRVMVGNEVSMKAFLHEGGKIDYIQDRVKCSDGEEKSMIMLSVNNSINHVTED